VWVADSYNHRLQRFSQGGTHQLTVGKLLGAGDFYFPADVATTTSGEVYVTGGGGHDVQRLDGAGTPIARWRTEPGASFSATPTANGVYVPQSGDQVMRYDSIGTLLDQFGSTGSGLGQLSYPAGSAADADGNLYVAERSNNRVQKFSPAGVPLAVFGSIGAGDGKLNIPRDVALDSAGNVYVADSANNRIQKFSPTGDFLTKWGSSGSGAGQFDDPRGLAVDANGHVFVSDDRNHRIQEFDANGNFIAKWGAFGAGQGELIRPAGLSVDSSGAVWVADEHNHRIVRFCCPAAHAAAGQDSGTPPPASGGVTDTADTSAPHITLGGSTLQRSRRVSRRGLALRIATSERAEVALRAVVSKRDMRRLHLRTASIARATTDLSADGTRALRLRLTASARRALLRTRTVRIVVRATAADPAGNRSSASFAVKVRRS
jgi:DNA-binding beta-propeller fold protein YncE